MACLCPVCGWTELPPDWKPGCHEICDCCGTQFGLDDMPYGSTVRVRTVSPDGVVGAPSEQPNPSPLQTEQAIWRMLRDRWIRAGMPWRHGEPPAGWNPHEQLRGVGEGV